MDGPCSLRIRQVETSRAAIAVAETGDGEHPILFIHGNSTSHAVFRRQLSADLLQGRRFIMIDLPGHGASGDAFDPHATYTRPGLADAVLEVVEALRLQRPTLVGWSLGGHIAIEMLPRLPALRALVLIGAPPVANGRFQDGFKASPLAGLASRPELTPDELEIFAHHILGSEVAADILASVERCDKQFRGRLFEGARQGLGLDQRQAVEDLDVPVAVINGADDPLINLDYFDNVPFKRLFLGRCLRIPETGHAPFWQHPNPFNDVLSTFLQDVEAGAT